MTTYTSSKASALVAVLMLIALTTLGIGVRPAKAEVRTLAPLDYQLLKACHEDDTLSALVAIAVGADVNVKDRYDDTPLIIAAGHNNPSIITALLDKGALLEEKDVLGHTALFSATVDGAASAVEILRQRHASTDLLNGLGFSYEAVASAAQPFSLCYYEVGIIIYSSADPMAETVDMLNHWRVEGELSVLQTVPPQWDPSWPEKLDEREVDPVKKQSAIEFAAKKGGERATEYVAAVAPRYRVEVIKALQRAFRAHGYDLHVGDDDVLTVVPSKTVIATPYKPTALDPDSSLKGLR